MEAMNRKNIPLLLMLTAGAVTCIITYVRQYSVTAKLVSLFAVLVIFWLLGSILEWTLNYFDAQNEKKRMEEGEVIEKEAETPDEDIADQVLKSSEAKTS